MKFLIASTLSLEGVPPPTTLEVQPFTLDGLRRLVAAGEKERWDAVFVDTDAIRQGAPLIKLLAAQGPIVVVGEASAELVEFAGSVDAIAYLAPPIRAVDLRVIEERLAAVRSPIPQQRAGKGPKEQEFIAASPAMQEVISLVTRLAPYTTTVTLYGESGTGKEVIARMLHDGSARSGGPFVPVNCGAIPEGLIESELFGHKKGAFTDATRDKPGLFEEASGGTLFLDEVGELPVTVQAKLLRALQEHRIRPVGGDAEVAVDVRIVAATLKDLDSEVSAGRFREDLYFRLNVVTIHLPPLRQRPEDIPLLADFFVKKHRKRLRLKVKGISREAMEILKRYPWKGNVRELENCIERGLVLTEKEVIDVESLPPHIRSLSSEGDLGGTFISDEEISIKKVTQEIELTLIQRALQRTGGNRTKAAKLLEISHRALLYKIKEYGLGE